MYLLPLEDAEASLSHFRDCIVWDVAFRHGYPLSQDCAICDYDARYHARDVNRRARTRGDTRWSLAVASHVTEDAAMRARGFVR